MAFMKNQSNAASGRNNARNANIKGYINYYLPTTTGGRKKLGSIPLNEDLPTHKQVLDRLNQNPEMIAKLVELLEVEYNPYNPESEENEIAF